MHGSGPQQIPEPLRVRLATLQDLPVIVDLLADDPLGALREKPEVPLPPAYLVAFRAISADTNNELLVAEDLIGQAIAVLQLTFTPYITHQGGWRATIEGVRVARPYRGSGLGRQFLAWAIARVQERRCHVIQLTTDKQRPEAKRFYESLGFVATHEGMKLKLPT
jgi:GNAT superfamily N-acetyltransferase